MLCTNAINTSNTIRTQTGAGQRQLVMSTVQRHATSTHFVLTGCTADTAN